MQAWWSGGGARRRQQHHSRPRTEHENQPAERSTDASASREPSEGFDHCDDPSRVFPRDGDRPRCWGRFRLAPRQPSATSPGRRIRASPRGFGCHQVPTCPEGASMVPPSVGTVNRCPWCDSCCSPEPGLGPRARQVDPLRRSTQLRTRDASAGDRGSRRCLGAQPQPFQCSLRRRRPTMVSTNPRSTSNRPIPT